MLDSLKSKFLLAVEKYGWYRHPKESKRFLGRDVIATKGAFLRKYEKDDAWLFLLSRNHKNILDVGCNIGQSSLIMLLGTDNKMVCVDPNPKALSLCAENLIYNRLSSQAGFVNAFVGENDNDEVEFFTIGSGAAGSIFAGFARTASKNKKSIQVRVRTVTSICRELMFLPDLIKIDVEGAEQLVLKGIDLSKIKVRPTLFVEMHSGEELDIVDNTMGILEWCSNNNYRAYYMKNHSLLTVDDIKSRGRYHALLLPDGTNYPDYLTQLPKNISLESLDTSK